MCGSWQCEGEDDPALGDLEQVMPWGAKDAKRHTKKADTPVEKRQWSHVANHILQMTGDEGRAVRGANAVVAKRGKKK